MTEQDDFVPITARIREIGDGEVLCLPGPRRSSRPLRARLRQLPEIAGVNGDEIPLSDQTATVVDKRSGVGVSKNRRQRALE